MGAGGRAGASAPHSRPTQRPKSTAQASDAAAQEPRRPRRFRTEDLKPRHFFHAGLNATVIKVFQGHCYVTDREDEVLSTVLGSCVAACIRDPEKGVGGMNHFMLPGEWKGSRDSTGKDSGLTSAGMRYGAFSMEQLINRILTAGGARHRLEVKLFGGGNVLRNAGDIGHRNALFVESFIKNEGLKIAARSLGGELPRSVFYFPTTGRVLVRTLPQAETASVIEDEARQSIRTRRQVPDAGSIELFD